MWIVRLVLGWLIGMLVAGSTIAGIEALGHTRAVGDGVFGVAVGGYFLGALGGSAVASWIAGPRLSVAVPITLAALALISVFAFPHPGWFVPLAALALTGGWFAGVWASQRLAPRHRKGADA
jgi:hypothetical protein